MTIFLVLLTYFTIAVFISGLLNLKEGEHVVAVVWGFLLPIALVVWLFQTVHALGMRCRTKCPSFISWWNQ